MTVTSFEDIDPDLLRRQAVEDWAVEVKPSDSLKKVVAALDKAGVDWDMYAERYGYGYTQVNDLDAPASVDAVAEPAPTEGAVVGRATEPTRVEKPVTEVDRGLPRPQIAYAAEPERDPEIQYLVKMERDNQRYSHLKYTWTKRHPYALVDGKDLENVLKHEPGFRQAYPSEASEFYS